MIFHLTTYPAWQKAQVEGVYSTPSLLTEGFIHFSTQAQLIATANRYYPGRFDLWVLTIQEANLTAPLVYEDSTGRGEQFPHLYGSLNLAAVVTAQPFMPRPDGLFTAEAWLEVQP